jgi:surface carbohydrate biosynthesis protein
MLCVHPIEIASRELDGALYLSLHLARAGYPSLIGEYMANRIATGCGRPVCYFDNDQHKETNDLILRNGGLVFNIDPEGLSAIDTTDAHVENYSRVADHVTKMCLWGNTQKKRISGFLTEKQRELISVTGHPSFDLLSDKFISLYEDPDIVNTYGRDFILFNTNYGFFNHAMGCDNYLKMLTSMKEWQMYATQEVQAHVKKISAYQEVLFNHTISLIEKIARQHPKTTIILRPHPQENLESYTSKLGHLDNLTVVNKGEVRAWLALAKVVIHHDCTTGMEATLMGVPVIQYRPCYDSGIVANVMIKIGQKAESDEEVLRLLDNMDQLRKSKLKDLDYISTFLENVKVPASKTLTKLVQSHDSGQSTWIPEPLGLFGQAECIRKYASKLLRSLQPGHNGKKVRYILNKYPRLPRRKVEKKIERMIALEPNLPEVNVKQICLSTFLITPHNV